MHPSHALYQALHTAYEHFNRELFRDRLPEVIFTVQRQKDVLGYFAPERWVSPEGTRCHEIAINPAHMGQSRVIEVLQTLVHEMVHCWQHCHGTPGRGSYHNKQWASKMIKIGLQPSSTGEVGGETTGQQMSDYPIEGGAFLSACESLVHNQSFRLPWIYRLSLPKHLVIPPGEQSDSPTPLTVFPEPNEITQPLSVGDDTAVETLSTPTPETFLHSTYQDVLPEGTFIAPPAQHKRSKAKYRCKSCHAAVWGKPHLHIVCGDCRIEFEEITD